MPLITPDLSQTGALDGTFRSKILDVGFETSKKGNPMVVVNHEIETPGGKRQRTGYHVITGNGAFMFDQLLRACGFGSVADSYKDPSQQHPQFDTDQLIGCELLVVVQKGMYEGKENDSISGYLKI